MERSRINGLVLPNDSAHDPRASAHGPSRNLPVHYGAQSARTPAGVQWNVESPTEQQVKSPTSELLVELVLTLVGTAGFDPAPPQTPFRIRGTINHARDDQPSKPRSDGASVVGVQGGFDWTAFLDDPAQ